MADPPHQAKAQHQDIFQESNSVGPQAWAVVLTTLIAFYVWNRVLGKSIPGFLRWGGQGNRVGARSSHRAGASFGSDSRRAEIAAARERQQRQLENLARQPKATKNGGARERTNALANKSGSNSSGLTIQQQQQLLQIEKQRKQKEKELEEKKKKQRQLYLKQKALKEKEEEMRKKDEELGPGWRHRENPDAATALGNMDPGGGGYKAQSRHKKKRGG